MHGPRLNRYAEYWAWYLGHHWGTRREFGDPQLTFNYIKAFADYINNFCFSRGIAFDTVKEFDHIIPALLKRIWQQDNNMKAVSWEMGQQGGVSGDCFVKIAYEPEWQDEAGNTHAGRVRILPLNSAFCFPTWHPHDRDRLLEFKLKYRFWGTNTEGTRSVYCVSADTQALTKEGWKYQQDITTDDFVLGIDPDTKEVSWQPVLSMHRFDYNGELIHWKNSYGFDALTTPNHRWLTAHRDRNGNSHFDAPGRFMLTEELSGSNKQIITGGGNVENNFPSIATHTNEFVELIGWVVTEGHYQYVTGKNVNGVLIAQSESTNPEKTARIRKLVDYFASQGFTATEQNSNRKADPLSRDFYFGKGIASQIRAAAPDKQLTSEFLCSLTYNQAELLYKTLIDADGTRTVPKHGRTVSTEMFIQKDQGRIDGFQMLCAMLGKRTNTTEMTQTDIYNTSVQQFKTTTARHLKDDREHYEGIVWCPKTPTGTWLARRNGGTYWTGNTYTELIRADIIREFVNDELIDERPNVLGEIPIVHIANHPASGSPWGMSDVQDIININRQYNETATDIADIVNYHAAPITVVIGAKPSQLEKGTNRVWSIGSKDVSVSNLENGVDLQWPLEVLNTLKLSMHEMTGVPESALGQSQPISNTSGVALSIQFMPLMQKFDLKKIQYGKGLQKINEFALRTLFYFEPEATLYNPDTEGIIQEGQPLALDPRDPLVYFSDIDWPSPLPVDKLIKLNEISAMMNLDLESRRGALKQMGEQFPDEKLQEIYDELHEDAVRDGALRMTRTKIDSVILALTGLVPQPDGTSEPNPNAIPETDAEGNPKPTKAGPGPMTMGDINTQQADGAGSMQALQDAVVQAYGTKLGSRQLPTDD
jgi:hypothetical protein